MSAKCCLQRHALLAQFEHVAWIRSHLGQWLQISAVPSLPSVVEAQAADRPRTGLIHDPGEHRAFGGFPVGRDSDDQGEDAAVRHLVECMQRELVARGNRLDELRPPLLRHGSLGLGTQHVGQYYQRLWTFVGNT